MIEQVRKWYLEKTGMQLPEASYRTLQDLISRRERDLSLTYHDYINYLLSDIQEQNSVIEELCITETYFFREEKSFYAFKEELAGIPLSEVVRVWSVTCSSGEEPLSIAALLKANGYSYNIYATDIHQPSLAIFQKGSYSINSFRKDGSSLHFLLSHIGTKTEDSFQIHKDIFQNIHIMHKNIFSDSLHEIPNNLHFVFFRNTMIYMPSSSRTKVLEKILSHLACEGFFFPGITEIPQIQMQTLSSVYRQGVYYLKKVSSELATEQPAPASSQNFAKSTFALSGVLRYLDRGDHHLALLSLKEHASLVSEEVYLYLQGKIAALQNEAEKSDIYYRSALRKNEAFWPAMFELVRNKQEYRQAEIMKLLSLLEDRHAGEWVFLYGDFDLKYFIEMVRRWLGTNHSEGRNEY